MKKKVKKNSTAVNSALLPPADVVDEYLALIGDFEGKGGEDLDDFSRRARDARNTVDKDYFG